MPRMRRGKDRAVERSIEQIANPEGQCIWCGRILAGEHKDEVWDELRGDIYTSGFCKDCKPEFDAHGYREVERRRAYKAGLPEEEWPPTLLSPLEQRTGSRYGKGVTNEQGEGRTRGVGGAPISTEHQPTPEENEAK